MPTWFWRSTLEPEAGISRRRTTARRPTSRRRRSRRCRTRTPASEPATAERGEDHEAVRDSAGHSAACRCPCAGPKPHDRRHDGSPSGSARRAGSIRAVALSPARPDRSRCWPSRYRLVAPIGNGASARVYLGRRHPAAPAGGGQGAPRGPGRRRGVPPALPGRGPGRRRAQPPQRHARLRLGHGRRRARTS